MQYARSGLIKDGPPIIKILKGTFYRQQPGHGSSSASGTPHPNPAFFPDLNFELSSKAHPQCWAVVGPSLSGKTTFLQMLRGDHFCRPHDARSYPLLATDAVPPNLKCPNRAFQYVGFDAKGFSRLGNSAPTYLSARYESRREKMDFTLRDFLLGDTQLNPAETPGPRDGEIKRGISMIRFDHVVSVCRLRDLLALPLEFLSNGQGRRAFIARSLLATPSPKVLLLDEPFMGLDPLMTTELNSVLQYVAQRTSTQLVVSARPQDPLPEWITHLVLLNTGREAKWLGVKNDVPANLRGGRTAEARELPVQDVADMGRVQGVAKDPMPPPTTGPLGHVAGDADGAAVATTTMPELGEALVEMQGCQVRYGTRVVLGNWTEIREGRATTGLHWTVRRGARWGVFGPNGSGKTTMVSLLCSDHPQAYSSPMKLFGRSRLPDPESGHDPLTFWDIQARIGHSSPEIHRHMPRSLTVRQVLESAWADTFMSKPNMGHEQEEQVDATLNWFESELNPGTPVQSRPAQSAGRPSWASRYLFGELSFSAQRVLLFLRAVIKHSDVVVLDEAFSGMDHVVRDKCMVFLAHGQAKVTGLTDGQALICISHVKEEVPDCVRSWMCLPEAETGQPARFGTLGRPLRFDSRRWMEIWRPVHDARQPGPIMEMDEPA